MRCSLIELIDDSQVTESPGAVDTIVAANGGGSGKVIGFSVVGSKFSVFCNILSLSSLWSAMITY